MKKLFLTLVFLFFGSNVFSQRAVLLKNDEEIKSEFENKSNLFSESVLVLNPLKNSSITELKFDNSTLQFDTSQLELKLNDYKIRSLNCNGQNISSQNLIQNLAIDEITNYLLKNIITTKVKL